MKRAIGELTLYKWRYGIGITIALLLAALVFILAAQYIPGGLRGAERTSAIASASLSLQTVDASSIVNLPYHFLQQISMSLLNASLLSIKLPSIFFAFAALAGFYLLSRQWFRTNVAAIASVVLISLPAYIFAAQDGTALMYTICLSLWLLLATTYISRDVKSALFWKILFVILFAFNLYAPLGIYLNFALVIMAIFHPHVRHFVRRLSKVRATIGIIVLLILLTPLALIAYRSPSVLLDLLGWPSSLGAVVDNSIITFGLLFDFSGNTVFEGIASPLLPLGILLLLMIGIYFLARAKHTAQSFIIAIWALLLVCLSIISPANTIYLIIVIALVLAAAVDGLLTSWYKIFPNNPYAHIVALFPTAIIVIGLFTAGIGQYTAAYYYNPNVVKQFSSDINLLPEIISYSGATPGMSVMLITSESQRDFFQAISKYKPGLVVTSNVPLSLPDSFAVSHDVYQEMGSTFDEQSINRIFVDRATNSADRFYLYTTIPK